MLNAFTRALAVVSALSVAGFPYMAAAQNTVRLECDVILELVGDTIQAYGIVFSNLPLTAEYEMEVTTISAANIGTTSQSGTLNVKTNEIAQTGRAQFGVSVAEEAFFEAEVFFKERLTGTECSAKRSL